MLRAGGLHSPPESLLPRFDTRVSAIAAGCYDGGLAPPSAGLAPASRHELSGRTRGQYVGFTAVAAWISAARSGAAVHSGVGQPYPLDSAACSYAGSPSARDDAASCAWFRGSPTRSTRGRCAARPAVDRFPPSGSPAAGVRGPPSPPDRLRTRPYARARWSGASSSPLPYGHSQRSSAAPPCATLLSRYGLGRLS